VITAITKKCLEFAAEKGAKKARLVTGSTNVPAQKVLEKLGFKSVATFLEWECENFEAEKSKFSSWAENSDLDKIWLYLQIQNASENPTVSTPSFSRGFLLTKMKLNVLSRMETA